MKEKVILAYSGGLDTTAIIPWLKENFDYDVICCCIDCGQGSELDGLEERAKLSGATKLYIEDIVDDFCDNYIIPCVQAGAVYENKYLLGTSMARPAIAKRLVEIARKENAAAICHGATGKGNDQIRFELGIKALAPDLKIIAPWRMTDVWTMQSREDEIEYCHQHGIDLPFSANSSYSRDRNLWHISHEGLELEDPANEPNYDHLLVLGVSPEKAPDEGEYVTMTFEKGVPTSVNGEQMKVSDVIRKLNELGGKHGAVEGVGADIACVFEQAQKLRRAGVKNALRLWMDLAADAAQLHHRKARFLRQTAVGLADIGGGVTNMAVLSTDGVIVGFSMNLGGRNMDVNVQKVLEYKGLRIGMLTAERIKNEIGSLSKNARGTTLAEGRSVYEAQPHSVSVEAAEISPCIRIYIDKILEYTAQALQQLPAEVAATVNQNGIYLSGGVMKLSGVADYIASRLKMTAHVCEEPQFACILGGGNLVRDKKLLDRLALKNEQ